MRTATDVAERDLAMASVIALALDLYLSCNHGRDAIWERIEPDVWRRTRNPWAVVHTAGSRRLRELCGDRSLREAVARAVREQRRVEESADWFPGTHGTEGLSRVAYFSMEFMLSHALPIYAGGLGNVAGDQLKAAHDLGVPVVGVGLLYQQGYVRQVIGEDGAQHALFPYNDPGQLPIVPARRADGTWVRITLPMRGQPLWLRVWGARVGRLRLFLLDSNDIANAPVHRGITSELYGGDSELRLQQELVLGIGGWRLLEALGLEPDVCHLNEGHAALAVLDRARAFMDQAKVPFQVALTATRAGNVFTTHTAVAAGFDEFESDLVAKYLSDYAQRSLGIPMNELLALGRADPRASSGRFNMAYLAMRGSSMIKGVSRLHGEVSRRIFLPLFPRWPARDVPVGHVTNGIHAPTWDCAPAARLWTECGGPHPWQRAPAEIAAAIAGISDEALWRCRSAGRRLLVDYVNESLAAGRAIPEAGSEAAEVPGLDADVLTLGFARRFATYKRPNLLLRDADRLARLLTDATRPVQIVVAGKAHPSDAPGQALVRAWVRFARRSDLRHRVVFLSDYDMAMAAQLVQGVDVWINTPQRPWEACGTSGMKVLVNGGINLSELDGWWAEAYSADVGWALGDGREHAADPGIDAAEAMRLYALLETEVVPEFYQRDANGIPGNWLRRIRASMSRLAPHFSANRAVREYVAECYLPAARAYRKRAANGAARSVEINRWRSELDRAWPGLRFIATDSTTADGVHRFTVTCAPGSLDANAIRAELYADASPTQPDGTWPMSRGTTTGTGILTFIASVPATRPSSDYTARIVPVFEDVGVPLEAQHVLWQR